MRLTAKRLIIKEWQPKDKKDLIENINNLKVSKNLLSVPYPYKKKDAEWWINYCKKEEKKKPRKNYEFAIELKSEKKVIGGISLNNFDRFQRNAELGYWLSEKYWRKGIMSEAIDKILNFAFNKLKLRRIYLFAYVDNLSSNRIVRTFGFRFEGKRIKAVRTKATGKIKDSNAYALLKEEWKKKSK